MDGKLTIQEVLSESVQTDGLRPTARRIGIAAPSLQRIIRGGGLGHKTIIRLPHSYPDNPDRQSRINAALYRYLFPTANGHE